MVFLPSRPPSEKDVCESDAESLSRGARLIIDLIDVVGNIRDGDHLQCVAFLAQEFGLMEEPHFLFGSTGSEPRRPHSLLLEGHFNALLRDGVIDLDGKGCLRLRRDLFALSYSGLAARRLSTLSMLSPREAAIFAGAVLRLAHEGRHAGSRRHDQAFLEAVTRYAMPMEDDSPGDPAAIDAVRARLLPAEHVMLVPV